MPGINISVMLPDTRLVQRQRGPGGLSENHIFLEISADTSVRIQLSMKHQAPITGGTRRDSMWTYPRVNVEASCHSGSKNQCCQAEKLNFRVMVVFKVHLCSPHKVFVRYILDGMRGTGCQHFRRWVCGTTGCAWRENTDIGC